MHHFEPNGTLTYKIDTLTFQGDPRSKVVVPMKYYMHITIYQLEKVFLRKKTYLRFNSYYIFSIN